MMMMMMMRQFALRSAVAIGLATLCMPASAMAQTSKSEAVAKELVTVLGEKKLDAIAARVPSGNDQFAAALYFPGVQLLVISGRYSAPQLMEPRLAKKDYRDTYMELTGTVAADSKVFVQDMGSPGLAQRKQDNTYDTWTQGAKVIMFDGDHDKQKMSEEEYLKSFTAADAEYTRILSALLAEAKK